MRRMRIGRTGGLLGVTATLLTATTHGQDATAIEEMARRLADIEKQNETLKTRVNELEAADADVWLTQERSDQIRGVVTDVLADAETRVSLQSSGMTAGWDDGFFLASPDGRFRLEVGGMVQTRYMYSHIREGWPSFDDQGQQQQPQAPFDRQHQRGDHQQGDQICQNANRAAAEDFSEGIDVAGQTGEQFAHRRAVVKPQ